MRLKNKSLVLNFGGYTVINLFNSLTPFIILPILTHNLTASDIGIIDLFTTTTIFLTPVIGLCFIQSITKLYFSIEDTPRYLSVLATCVSALGLGAFLLCAFLLYGTNLIPLPEDYRFIVLLIFLYVCTNLIIEGFLLLKRNEENLKHFAVIRLAKSFLDILLTVFLINVFESYESRIYAMVIAGAAVSAAVVWLVVRNPNIRFTYDGTMVRKIFIYSYPLIFHTFFASVLNYADRYFIGDLLGTSDLGQYSVVYQLCMVMSLLITSFNMAWLPYFMKNMTANPGSFKVQSARIFKYYAGILLVFGALFYLAIPVIYQYYVGNDYLVDSAIYLTLLSAYFFNGLYRFKVGHLFFRERTLSVARLSMITAIVNLVLNYICIRAWGIFGAAFSTLVSYALLYLLLEMELYLTNRNESLT